MSAGQELTTQQENVQLTPQQKTRELIYSKEAQFRQAWGNDANSASRFMLAAANAINNDKTGKLIQCTPTSILSCLMQLCQWRLLLGDAMGHAYLSPFFNKDIKAYECTILVGYKGYCNLAYRSNLPSWIQATAVHAKDEFDYSLGSASFIAHKKSPEKDRGPRIGVYLIIQFKDGSKFIDYMTAEEIEPIKEFALKNKSGFSPWKGPFESEMWAKSILRRDAKRLPLGELFEQAATYEAQVETQLAEQEHPALPFPRKALAARGSEMKQVTGRIIEVKRETKRTRKKNSEAILYTVVLAQDVANSVPESYATFDEPTGTKAMNLEGSFVELEYREEEYGNYLYGVEEIEPEEDTNGLEYFDTLE